MNEMQAFQLKVQFQNSHPNLNKVKINYKNMKYRLSLVINMVGGRKFDNPEVRQARSPTQSVCSSLPLVTKCHVIRLQQTALNN